jgi:hypothetical protein
MIRMAIVRLFFYFLNADQNELFEYVASLKRFTLIYFYF